MALDGPILHNPPQAVVAQVLVLKRVIEDKNNYLLTCLENFHIKVAEGFQVIAIEILDDLGVLIAL